VDELDGVLDDVRCWSREAHPNVHGRQHLSRIGRNAATVLQQTVCDGRVVGLVGTVGVLCQLRHRLPDAHAHLQERPLRRTGRTASDVSYDGLPSGILVGVVEVVELLNDVRSWRREAHAGLQWRHLPRTI